MARIKVTGYIETDDLPFEEVDLSHKMGLSTLGYDRAAGLGEVADPNSIGNMRLSSLDDPDFEKVRD